MRIAVLALLLWADVSRSGDVSLASSSDIAVEDPVSLVGNTGCAAPPRPDACRRRPRAAPLTRPRPAAMRARRSTLGTCQSYQGGVCASGGFKILVPDAAEPGLVAHYTFDDARSSDSSGHGNHAKTAPLAGPGHGPTGAGAWFDGTTSMMEVPHIPQMESPDMTVSFWMYLLEDSTNSYRTLLRKAKEPSDMTPALMLLPNERRLHVRLAVTGSAVIGFDSTALIPLRRWVHVAYVVKGGAALSLYVNGVKDCPHSHGLRRGECPPGGSTYAWDEGDVLHNSGPLYVGADPFMQGTAMFFDSLKIFNTALPERDIVVEANDALGPLGTTFLRLGCANCTERELQASCSEVDGYHPCLCQELMSGGLQQARAMGWLRGASSKWEFHADVQNPTTCHIVSGPQPASATGFCCRDL